MTDPNRRPPKNTADLRRRAEALLRQHILNRAAPTADEVSRLVHELEVHHVELEIQNEELRLAQRELELARDRYADLYDFAPAGYMTIDANGRIVELNLVAAEMLGVARGRLVGHPFISYVHSRDKNSFVKHLQACLAGDKELICEVEIDPKSDRPSIAVQLNSLAFPDGQGGRFCRMVMVDVSERRRMLDQLEEARRAADQANIAKSQFLANMSHELRTPMSAILGMTELALEEDLPAQAQEYLGTVKRAADSLLQLLNEILDFSRIEAGEMEIELAPFRFRGLIGETCRMLGSTAEEKGLRLTCEIASDVPDWVIGDPLRLRQVLTYLIGNAVKFTRGGLIAIRAVVRKENDAQVDLEFAVADTGIGITDDDLRKIFSPFIQADPSMSRHFGGTGLGLSIAANLIRAMGGEIWVESTPGLGSTFFFTLRLTRTAEPVKPPDLHEPGANAAGTAVRPLRILLVEDTPTNQKLVTSMLAKRGHHVDVAEHGQAALDRLSEQQYDVILMDVQMPVMNGFQATAEIRRLPDVFKSQVPIVAMTAHAMRGDPERCLAAGMDAYLGKPVDRAQLIELVERMARK